jgi:hypothetical protein
MQTVARAVPPVEQASTVDGDLKGESVLRVVHRVAGDFFDPLLSGSALVSRRKANQR